MKSRLHVDAPLAMTAVIRTAVIRTAVIRTAVIRTALIQRKHCVRRSENYIRTSQRMIEERSSSYSEGMLFVQPACRSQTSNCVVMCIICRFVLPLMSDISNIAFFVHWRGLLGKQHGSIKQDMQQQQQNFFFLLFL